MLLVHQTHLTLRCSLCINNDMEKLSSYLSSQKITQRQFAEAVGVDQSVVSRLTRLEMMPSLELAVKIQNATGGAVPATSWIPESTPEQDVA